MLLNPSSHLGILSRFFWGMWESKSLFNWRFPASHPRFLRVCRFFCYSKKWRVCEHRQSDVFFPNYDLLILNPILIPLINQGIVLNDVVSPRDGGGFTISVIEKSILTIGDPNLAGRASVHEFHWWWEVFLIVILCGALVGVVVFPGVSMTLSSCSVPRRCWICHLTLGSSPCIFWGMW